MNPFKRTFFGGVLSDEGFVVSTYGHNAIRLRKDGAEYFVFVEWLGTEKFSVQVDDSAVWSDEHFKQKIEDLELKEQILKIAVAYLDFSNIGH